MFRKNKIKIVGFIMIAAVVAAWLFCGFMFMNNRKESKREEKAEYTESTIDYSDEESPAMVENDQGEVVETEGIPTVDEVDGGMFEDATTGISSALTTDVYNDLGWSEIYNVSSPEAFANDTLGKCIIANNIYGAQCVSLARVFWWSYADRDVSTCGTGMAKGMMNCWEQNAGDDFITYWADSVNNIQAGDWLIFGNGKYGHVGMALGPVYNGYVVLLGENQGGASCGSGVGGSATNRINISVNSLIGFYRPKAYVKNVPQPSPEPSEESCDVITVKAGDTMGDIMKRCEGQVVYGEAMREYAKSWYSTKYVLYPTVYDGWVSEGRYGLFAGDVIERRK